jgi:hypothetical protein
MALNGLSYQGVFPDIGDYMYYVADIWATGVQYGHRVELCNMVMSDDWKNDPVKRIKLLHDFAYTTVGVFVDGYDVSATLTDTLMLPDRSVRQWTWQYCTEWGFFQEANIYYPMRSTLVSHDYFIDFCKRIFGDDVPYP